LTGASDFVKIAAGGRLDEDSENRRYAEKIAP